MPAIKDAVLKTGTDQPIYNIRTMQELVSNSLWPQRFPMLLLSAFAVLALLLACIGIYGVTSYATARRVPELGIRVALIGATAGVILTQMLPSFSHLLYGVRASDPFTYTGVSLLLIGATVLACYIPARQAARVDPMITLRHE